jgi:hypothetical protein
MFRPLSILSLTLYWNTLVAQDKIETDRPSETYSTQTLSKKQFQVELGFQKEQLNHQDYTVQHPETELRLGITDKLELRSRVVAETQKLYTEEEFRYGLTPIELGTKINFFESANQKFTSSFIGYIGIPVLNSEDHDPGKAFHRLRLLFENKLKEQLKLEYNIGTEWNSEEHEQNWVFTISPQAKLADRWTIYVEEFSYFHKNSLPQHHLQGGLAYIIGNNVQVDASGGLGLNSASPEYIINAGLSFRLGK